jgi:hypothetical protein
MAYIVISVTTSAIPPGFKQDTLSYNDYDKWPSLMAVTWSTAGSPAVSHVAAPSRHNLRELALLLNSYTTIYAFNALFASSTLAAAMTRTGIRDAREFAWFAKCKCLMIRSKQYMHYSGVSKYPRLQEAFDELADKATIARVRAEPDEAKRRCVKAAALAVYVNRVAF